VHEDVGFLTFLQDARALDALHPVGPLGRGFAPGVAVVEHALQGGDRGRLEVAFLGPHRAEPHEHLERLEALGAADRAGVARGAVPDLGLRGELLEAVVIHRVVDEAADVQVRAYGHRAAARAPAALDTTQEVVFLHKSSLFDAHFILQFWFLTQVGRTMKRCTATHIR
jgi:hypothetical protein